MTASSKIAVSLPTQTLRLVEQARKRLKRTRSAVVAEALEQWLRNSETSDSDARYAQGYLRVPEMNSDIEAVAIQATAHWDKWE